MKRNLVLGTMGVVMIFLVAFGIFVRQSENKANSVSQSKVVVVDEVAMYPDRFTTGSIGVSGKVTEVNPSKSYFVLGCEDACVILPVKYTEKMPALGSNIVVYGEVKVAEGGKYIFDGKDVKSQ